MSEKHNNPENQAITVGGVIRWGTVVLLLIGTLGGAVVKFVRHDDAIESLQKQTVDNDHKSAERDQRQEGEITDNRNRITAVEKSTSDLSSKLDNAITILKRIDDKVGHP